MLNRKKSLSELGDKTEGEMAVGELNRKKSLNEVLEEERDGGRGREEVGRPPGGGPADPIKRLEKWQECLVKALVDMPPEMAEKVVPALPKDVLIKALEASDDPFVRLALRLLALNR